MKSRTPRLTDETVSVVNISQWDYNFILSIRRVFVNRFLNVEEGNHLKLGALDTSKIRGLPHLQNKFRLF